jgi:hypothetical protein
MRLVMFVVLTPLFFLVLRVQLASGEQQEARIPNSASPFYQPEPPTRDGGAIEIVQRAISSLGATNSLTAVQDCVLSGVSESDSNPDSRTDFTWTVAGDEFRFDVKRAGGSGFFLSGHGRPANVFNGKLTAVNYHVAKANLPYFLPGLLLSRELSNPNFSVKYLGPSSVGGKQAKHVQLSDGSGKLEFLISPQDWYFDPSSGLPLRVEFRIPTNENAADWIKGVYDFSNFQPVTGMLIPFQILFSRERMLPHVITFNSVVFNTGISPSIFDAPQEASR